MIDATTWTYNKHQFEACFSSLHCNNWDLSKAFDIVWNDHMAFGLENRDNAVFVVNLLDRIIKWVNSGGLPNGDPWKLWTKEIE